MDFPPRATRRTYEMRDKMYKKFIDKVKDRRIIPWKEYDKIFDDIVEQNPEFKGYIRSTVVEPHGWRYQFLREADEPGFYYVLNESMNA